MKISDTYISKERVASRVSTQVWLAVTCANEHGIEVLESKSTGQLLINFPKDSDGGYSSKAFNSWDTFATYIAGYHSGHCDARGIKPGGPCSCGGNDCEVTP